jgi:hypothetical protein
MRFIRLLAFIKIAMVIVPVIAVCNPPIHALGVGIYYPYDLKTGIVGEHQVELSSTMGIRVFIDIARPELVLTPPLPRDFLLTTHMHFDHFNNGFADSFPGKQLRQEIGMLETSDVRILGIPSSHSDDPPQDTAQYLSNIIFRIDIDGLRIAHLGDTVQLKLTEKQLNELGEVHIALMPFWGKEERCFERVNQLKPHIVIPTHLGEDERSIRAALSRIIDSWPTFIAVENKMVLSISDIPTKTSFLLLGDRAKEYRKYLPLKEWSRN